jgi:hypothetical protein
MRGGTVGTSVKCHHYHQGLWERIQPVHRPSVTTIIRVYERGFSRYIGQVSPLSSGSMREGFSRYIGQVSPISSGSMREGFSRYIGQVSPLSSGPMRGGFVGTSIKCRHYHHGLRRWGSSVGTSVMFLSSVTTTIRPYERRGTVGTSIKCPHYHQGQWERVQ